MKHADEYITTEGVTTNGVEGVWSLFKRGIVGQFHKVSAKYLSLYLDEFAFRFNNPIEGGDVPARVANQPRRLKRNYAG